MLIGSVSYIFAIDPYIANTPSIQSSLPVLNIVTDDFNELVDKDFSTASATYFNERGIADFIDLPLQIRYRGNGTFEKDKKPYKLKFDTAINLLEKADQQSKNWVLLADYNDTSLLRNYTALSLAQIFSNIAYSVDFRLVELVLNDEHLGTFLLTEQVEISPTVIDLDEEIGDILLERVTISKQDISFEVDGLHRTVTYDVRSEIYDDTQVERAENIINIIEQALRDANEEVLREYIDIDSAVDYYLTQEFMKNIDVGYGSSYMYIPAETDKLYFTTPWDFDISGGNHYWLDAAITNIYTLEVRLMITRNFISDIVGFNSLCKWIGFMNLQLTDFLNVQTKFRIFY